MDLDPPGGCCVLELYGLLTLSRLTGMLRSASLLHSRTRFQYSIFFESNPVWSLSQNVISLLSTQKHPLPTPHIPLHAACYSKRHQLSPPLHTTPLNSTNKAWRCDVDNDWTEDPIGFKAPNGPKLVQQFTLRADVSPGESNQWCAKVSGPQNR